MNSNKQQNILRYVMIEMDLTRNQFAEKFNVSRRSLDAWLLPNESKGFRPMGMEMQIRLAEAMDEQRFKSRNITEGSLSAAVPVIYCDKFDFNFPSLYRVHLKHGPAFDINDEKTRELIKDYPQEEQDKCYQDNGTSYAYALSDNLSIKPPAKNSSFLSVEPINKRNTALDEGWLVITEHRSYERADAYVKGYLDLQMVTSHPRLRTYYTFEGRIFTLISMAKPLHLPGAPEIATLYRSDDYLHHHNWNLGQMQFSRVDSLSWGKTFNAEGEEIELPFYDD